MKQIFSGQELEELLKKSVKINRVFFQSKNIKSLDKWRELEDFCFEYVEKVICKIDPKLIIAESVGTFNSLIYRFKGVSHTEPLLVHNNKILLRSGLMENKLLLGLQHPTSARGISNEQWKIVTGKLNEILIGKEYRKLLVS